MTASERRPQSAAEARAEMEATRADRAEARRAEMDAAFGGRVPGGAIRTASWVGTMGMTVVSGLAVADPDDFLPAFFVVSFAIFVLGAVAVVVDVVLAASRSRSDSMGIGGLFFLAGCAPRAVQVSMNASLAVAATVSIITPIARLSTPELAFGTLAPLFQLSMTGLWGVRHGLFPPRPDVDA